MFEFRGRGVGVWTLFRGLIFFSASELVIVLFTSFFATFSVFICIIGLSFLLTIFLTVQLGL